MAEEAKQSSDPNATSATPGTVDADDYKTYMECIEVFLKHFERLGICIAIAGTSAALIFFSRSLFPPFPVLLKIAGTVLFTFSSLLSILIAGDTYVRLSQYIPSVKPKKFLNHQWMDRLLLWFLLILSLFIVISASIIVHTALFN
ncbi:hypothetical protein Q8A64_10860 [Oxalobacteraceae bacterium R-40]|uniref:Uncharacterized protein n=1 Tax=Keguizhuia sedimenti TaxID=3064264 RepID=A0ABU1BPH2_9BURK|nr:hypothetical protein [Oxalobacteraceae bacterium R-40]